VDACRRWLDAQLRLVDPELIVVLGLTAASALLGSKARLADLRGRVHQVGGRRLLVSYHPAAALRGGPDGAPARALRADLAWAAALLHDSELLHQAAGSTSGADPAPRSAVDHSQGKVG
jgi:DNA polymerase